MLTQWWFVALFGMFFGLTIMRFWVMGRVAHAVRVEKRELPVWLFYLAGSPPNATYAKMRPLGDKVGQPQKVFSIVAVVTVFVFYHLTVFSTTPSASLQPTEVLALETGFPLFIILGFLIPVFLVSRYIRQLPRQRGDEA